MMSTQDFSATSVRPESGDATRAGQPGRGALWSTVADVCRLLRLETKAQYVGEETLFQHRRLKPGQRLYHAGQGFEALYVVNSGYLKTLIVDGEGNERVLSFPMKGDLLGSDGICKDRHASEVVALSDCDLIVIPFRQLVALGHSCDEFEEVIYRVISRELVQEHINLATLGALHSDARVAHFIAMQAERHAALGFSSRAFLLRMTRREIGSYLGLTLETVSRSLSALHTAGTICIDQRDVQILKPEALRTMRRAPAEVPPQPRIHSVSTKQTRPARPSKIRAATPWQTLQAAA
jgi:CRP/FNR family transcriptional regulator, anaerobic regulatory protein